MITELSPLLSRVATEVKQEDLILQKKAWVYFSASWPGTWKWASGKLFEVSEEPILVKYPASFILPASDYKNLDLSNSTNGLKLYPESEGILYQAAVGFKPGDYITNLYVPSTSKYVYQLGDSSMFPAVDNATTRYLGAKRPEDSPAKSPLLFLYFIKGSPPFYLQPYVLESVSYEQVTIEFNINKCKLTEIPSPDEDMVKKARRIAFYTELTGF